MSSPFIPGGSYVQTSTDIESNLYCESQKRDGSWIPAGFNLTDVDSADLANMDGFLVNGNGNPAPNNYIPGGSYLQTSKSPQVILSAQCRKIDGSMQWSTLNITDLDRSKTVSNIDGVLTVD